MSSESMKITIPLALLTTVIIIFCGIIGWIVNDKLSDINTNITGLKNEVKSVNMTFMNHETRISIIEEKLKPGYGKETK